MLRELHISNLAVIADARVEFTAGLNGFTGATGAGKSLVIGAVELLLGLRSPGEMLRAGCDEGRVSGVFEIKVAEQLELIGQITDVAVSADEDLLLVRRLFASGRSTASLNGNPITMAMLKQVGELLVDVHGQHDHQYLLKPANQLDVLDRYADLLPLRQKYRDAFTAWQQAKVKLETLSAGERQRKQQLEFLRFQADEIDAAEPDATEFGELESRQDVLDNLGRLRRDSEHAYSALYDADGSIVERLKHVYGTLVDLANLDPKLKQVSEQVGESVLTLEASAFDLNRYAERLDVNPGEAEEITERLNTLNRLVKKYGNGIEDVIAHRAQIGAELKTLETATADVETLQAQLKPLEEQTKKLAAELSAGRKKGLSSLAPRVESQLAELGMDKAQFRVELTELPRPEPSGQDAAEFVVRTNPGLPPAPLRRVASGGEIGRIMLALKGVLAAGDRVSVLVFDEIDANIGGRLGSVIGRKLRDLAGHHQVLCITHLPQIAAFADRHFTVRKEQAGDRTSTTVRTVEGAERVEELAEMIGGAHLTATTRAQAQELLDAGTRPAAKPAVEVFTTDAAKPRRRVAARA